MKANETNEYDELNKSLLEKMRHRDYLESEIKSLLEVLKEEKNVGMSGNLVDEEGYPRSDIDIYLVRITRHKINCLQNDLRHLMEEIAEGINRLHQLAAPKDGLEDEEMAGLEAFLLVQKVDRDSPAFLANLRVGDEIVKFGSVNKDNFLDMKSIAEVVQNSVGKSIQVKVLRNRKVYHLTLTPQPWSGPGMLGCLLVPKVTE